MYLRVDQEIGSYFGDFSEVRCICGTLMMRTDGTWHCDGCLKDYRLAPVVAWVIKEVQDE